MIPYFFSLIGHTITEIQHDDSSVTITTDKGKCRLEHQQDCCETVNLEKVIGNPQDLVGQTIIVSEEDVPKDPEWHSGNYESHTWTMFKLSSQTHTVEFWFLGVSNGYYSESVSFIDLTD